MPEKEQGGAAPLWYKDAIIYELHVKSFFDSANKGVGDLKGLTQKLEYLESLGITAVWLLPFYPSPLRDDGYDISDYFDIHTDYGQLRDFKLFLREAHRRGLKVITELVLNHTSDLHIWFQRARNSKPNSAYRNYYVWSDTPEKYTEARIIFKDFESSNWSWDPVAKTYYWHRFYAHQPDLNFKSARVQKALFKVVDFWFELGVDGLRLDAVPYLFEREETNCENLPETHEYLKKLRAHVDSKFKDRMLLAEANQWPDDASAYFGKGNECHMAFHFPLMPRMFMGIQMEDRFPIIDILEQTPKIPDSCQWALFLRNHDELTLEMVTDEERDYMYRAYARDPRSRINLGIRRRLAPLLENNRRLIELMNILLFSLPGTPIIYYGDEIGMGDNYFLGDRNGVRTPMQWSPDKNAGFSRTGPHELYLPVIIEPEYHYESINVENQEKNASSLLWWMRKLIAMRKRFKAFGRGSLEFPPSDNAKVLNFIRKHDNETMLVVVNISKFSQVVNIELQDYSGYMPEEVFSKNLFPAINEEPYLLTIGPYSYYWFQLKRKGEIAAGLAERTIPEIILRTGMKDLLFGARKDDFRKEMLPNYLRQCRWIKWQGQDIEISDIIPIQKDEEPFYFLVLDLMGAQRTVETYLLPLSFSMKSNAQNLIDEFPQSVVAFANMKGADWVLYDASYNADFHDALVWMIAEKRKLKGRAGELAALPGLHFKNLILGKPLPLGSRLLRGEQQKTFILYEDIFLAKFYRKLDEGMNPDTEINKFLSERACYPHVPPFAGSIEYRKSNEESRVVGLLQGFVPNEGDAWAYAERSLGQFYKNVLASKELEQGLLKPFPKDLLQYQEPAKEIREGIGPYFLEMMRLLGKRTGEFHLALVSAPNIPAFSPEPFTMHHQRSIYQSMRTLVRKVMYRVRSSPIRFPAQVREEAMDVFSSEAKVLGRAQSIFEKRIKAARIRIHGDYNLGHVLFSGKDFNIIDFEGEPSKTLTQRRLKRSPLRDIASMLRSFHYAAYSALLATKSSMPEEFPRLEPTIEPWYYFVASSFLSSYLDTVKGAIFIPAKEDMENLLYAFLIEKAVLEVDYELDNRPDWLIIPIKGLKQVLG